MKIVFPESVERELAQQAATKTTDGSANVQTALNDAIPQAEQKIVELSEAELQAREREIQKITSKLYQPESPLAPEYRSKSAEIEERLERIQKRFEALREKEAARNEQLGREAWLKYNHLSKPTISDFKRPLTSFFLLASAIYMTMQYSWYALEREDYIEKKEEQQSRLVDELNSAFKDQAVVLDEYNNMRAAKKWWKFWYA